MQKFRIKNYKIILDWASKKTTNSVIRFIFLWIAMNHWYKTRYEKEKLNLADRDCLEKIKSDYQIYHRLLNYQNLSRKLEESLVKSSDTACKLHFKNVPKIMFDRSHVTQDQQNYATIIELIYELRTKIFHGDISVNDKNIRNLSKHLNNFLYYFIGEIILNPKITK